VGYVDARIRSGREAEIEKKYEDLVKGAFVAENRDLVRAWQTLAGSDSDVNESIRLLEQVIEAEGYNPSVAYFLLGCAHHRVAIKSRHKLEFDKSAVDSAHHAYMVSLDLARGNKRLLAAVYANLGHLHSLARNYGQAASFFAQRIKLPFVSKDDNVATLWRAAKLMYAGNNAPQALRYMESALAMIGETKYAKWRRAYLEAAAFYALDSENWERSEQYYNEFFASAGQTSPRNNLKAQSGLAWVLFKQGKNADAARAAQTVLKTYSSVSDDAKNSESLVPFRANRYAAQAFAVLAAIEPEPSKAVTFREQRLAILESWEKELDAFSLRRADWRGFVLREMQQVAALQTAAAVSNPLASWERCVDALQKHYELKSDAFDQAYFYVILNTLVVAVDRKAPVPASLKPKLDTLVPAYIAKLGDVVAGNNVWVARWYRVSLLWNAYLVQSGRMSNLQERQARDILLASAAMRDVLDTDPVIFASLPGRAKITGTLPFTDKEKAQ
jgi:hypothetical protein